MSNQKKLLLQYCILFYALAAYKIINQQLLSQNFLFFSINEADVTGLIFTQSGAANFLLQHPFCISIIEIIFYAMPLVLSASNYLHSSYCHRIAIITVLVNFLYVLIHSIFIATSIHSQLVWIVVPLIFTVRDKERSALLFDGIRYFFLFFFCSAGIWKIVNGGAFYPNQFAEILLRQHADLLFNQPKHWYSQFMFALTGNRILCNLLYRAAIVLQVFFITGFMTKRFDRLLILMFLIFVGFDFFLMRIPYFETFPYLLFLQNRSNASKKQAFSGTIPA